MCEDCAATEAVFACILAAYSEEQYALLEKLVEDEKLEDIDACKYIQNFKKYFQKIRKLEETSTFIHNARNYRLAI